MIVLCSTYNSMVAYGFSVCSSIRLASLFECNSSEVFGPTAVVFGRIIAHDV